jgi:hypothetical protein
MAKTLKYVGDNKWFLVLGQTVEPGQMIEVDDDTARTLLTYKEGLKRTGHYEKGPTGAPVPVTTGTEKFIFEEVK